MGLFVTINFSGQHNDSISGGVTTTDILSTQYSLSFRTTIEAPFSLALESKLPL